MPRRSWLDLPGIPQHVVQRGNDRQPCFFQEAEYLRHLQELNEVALRRQCAVLAALMQALGRRYVRYVNAAITAPARVGGAL